MIQIPNIYSTMSTVAGFVDWAIFLPVTKKRTKMRRGKPGFLHQGFCGAMDISNIETGSPRRRKAARKMQNGPTTLRMPSS